MLLSGLTILFVGLKLMEIIDWSWWWVISPLYPYFVMIALPFILLSLIKVGELFSRKKALV